MNTSAVTLDNLIAYCESLAGEFSNRTNRVRSFVSHNLTSGTANESILRNFLSDISAGIFSVGEGFLCNPMRTTSSRQCDILVYDQRFPLVHSEGDVKIVWPEAALMVVEMKTSMTSKKILKDAIQNIVSAKATESVRRLGGFMFSFKSLQPSKALEILSQYEGEKRHRPVAVILFDKGVVIHQRDFSDWRFIGAESDYEIRWCKGRDKSAVALTYLLLVFFWLEMSYAPGFRATEDLIMAITQFMEERTVTDPAEL